MVLVIRKKNLNQKKKWSQLFVKQRVPQKKLFFEAICDLS